MSNNDNIRALTLQKNFLRYGTVNPSLLQVAKSFPARLMSSLKKKSDTFYPVDSYGWLGFGSVISDITKENYIREGYNKSATLYSVVRKIAKTCAYAPWGAYKIVDEQSFKRYKSMSMQAQKPGTFNNMLMLRRKALEPVNDARLNDLMDNPNPTMDGTEYLEGLFTYKLLTGDAYEWGRLLDGGVNRGKPQELWLLPSQAMCIVPTYTFPIMIDHYSMIAGQEIQFSSEEILHLKYFNPNYSNLGSHLYGFSPLQAGWLSVQQDNDAKDAAIEMLQNRGVRGVLAMESWTPKEMTEKLAKEQSGILKERWRQEMIENRGGVVQVGGAASFVQMGLSLADLKILEISGYTQDDICNLYGIWSGLFNSESNQKYDNVEEFRKDFILNVIIPELNSRRSAINKKLQTDWGYKGSGIVLDYDSSVYTELQSDMKDMASWLTQAWWFTGNEKRVFMDENENENPMMNEILVPKTLAPLNENLGLINIQNNGKTNIQGEETAKE